MNAEVLGAKGNTAPKRVERVPTGIPEMDNLISGYPKNRTTLIMGGAGTGKTILTMHFIKSACERGEKCFQILTEEEKEDIFAQAWTFGWDFAKFEADGLLTVVELLPDRAAGAKLPDGFQHLIERVRPPMGVNLILDNLSVFGTSTDTRRFRDQMDVLVYKLKQHGSTTLLVYDEDVQEDLKNSVTHSSFGVVRLFWRNNPFTDSRERVMEIVKMRSTKVPSSYIFYELTDSGMKITGAGKSNGPK
jgi:KaiC/GvpD/RAD55 family RecA-like ATPase